MEHVSLKNDFLSLVGVTTHLTYLTSIPNITKTHNV